MRDPLCWYMRRWERRRLPAHVRLRQARQRRDHPCHVRLSIRIRRAIAEVDALFGLS